MKYQNYSTEDFVMDEFFQQWVIKPTYESSMFWRSWIANHPSKRQLIDEAKQIVIFLRFKAFCVSSKADVLVVKENISD
jgi:hypothetical protein